MGGKAFAAAGTKVFFAAADGIHGNELWSTDGTPGGTALAADVWPGLLSSDPRELTALGDDLAFVAQTRFAGAELRRFAPCTARKFQTVADIAPGPSWSEPTDLLWDSSRAVLVFSASDGLHGREPWEWRPGDTLGVCPHP
jgi:ELWxxDGT repeat protein